MQEENTAKTAASLPHEKGVRKLSSNQKAEINEQEKQKISVEENYPKVRISCKNFIYNRFLLLLYSTIIYI